MSKQANPKAIGSFVVGAIFLLIAGVLTFGTGEFMTERPNLILYFEGSLGGLSIGSPVNFRGVKVGSVTDVSVHYNPKDMSALLPVLIKMEGKVKIKGDVELDPKKTFPALVKRGLRAQLRTQFHRRFSR
jgi:paraquat-inducible protein B